MSTVQKETLNAIVNAFNAASDDPTRFHIQQVLLRKESTDKVCIVATNGHILIEKHVIDPEFAATLGKDDFVVAPDCLKPLKLLSKEAKYMPGIEALRDQDRIVIGNAALFGFSVTIKTAKESNIQFPDYKQVTPNYDNRETMEIGFNAEYIIALADALRTDKRQKNVKLVIKDKLSPILVTLAGVDDAIGVLMPVRV